MFCMQVRLDLASSGRVTASLVEHPLTVGFYALQQLPLPCHDKLANGWSFWLLNV